MDENKINNPEENVSDVTSVPESAPAADDEVNESIFISLAEIEGKSQVETAEEAVAPEVQYVYRWNYDSQSLHDREDTQGNNRKGLRNYAIVMSIALFSAIALLLGVLFVGNGGAPTGASLDTLYAECYPSYVAISIVTDNGTSGAGSGIIMTSDGYIATNYHVIEDAKTINVILYDGTTADADYVDGDELNDIAIIKIAKKGLKSAKIGRSSDIRVGEQVMAIGTPHSINYRGTMTSGYISATNRQYAAQNDNGSIKKVVTLLQTDTSVNPGNSGGPLFNMRGEVVGIVSMKIAGSQYEGLGFAIPIDGVIDMLYDIIENGELTISNGGSAFEGAAIGITGMTAVKDTTYLLMGDDIIVTVLNENGELCVENIYGEYIPITDTEKMAEMGIINYEMYKAPATGVRVTATASGFDSAKKLKVNDIIIMANGISCSQMEILQGIIATCRVGDTLELEVWRDGDIVSVSVELGRSASME